MVRFFVPEELYGGILGFYSPTGMTLREWEIVDHFIQWKTDDVPRGDLPGLVLIFSPGDRASGSLPVVAFPARRRCM